MHKLVVLLGLSLMLVWAAAYTNPVQGDRDSPDPGVIYYQGAYIAVTTGGWDGHFFPIWFSQTGTNFTHRGWGLLDPPSWTVCCDYWAPQIHIINQNILLYYTARNKDRKLVIGVAVASLGNILGPYIDKGEPLVSNKSEGVIDATILRDGVQRYLVYKVDGNAHGKPTQLWAVLLDPTGLNTRGDPVFLLRNDQHWEKGIVEGQWLIQKDDYYYLFYSGAGYADAGYSVGVARSTNPLGPYRKYESNPVLKTRQPMTNSSWEGPGHCSVLQSFRGEWLMWYHAWPHGKIGTKRLMLLDRISWVNDWPIVNDGSPSEKQQPSVS